MIAGRFNLPIAMIEPGIFLSHPTTAKTASYHCALTTVSIESAMISLETKENRIPSVPLDIPSLTPMVLNIKPTKFSYCTLALTSFAKSLRCILQGFPS